MSTLGRILRTIEHGFAFIGICTTAAAGLALYSFYSYRKEQFTMDSTGKLFRSAIGRYRKALPSEFVLHLDLDDVCVEDVPSSTAWESFFGHGTTTMSLRSVVKSIESASEDERVKGLVATGCAGLPGLACIQEMRGAVMKFNDVKKPFKSAFYTDTFGEAENKMLAYYFSSAFDKIYLQPTGFLVATGFCVHVPFLKDLMEKWNVSFRVWARKEYKTLHNIFTEKTFTPEHKEQLDRTLTMIYEQVTSGIAHGRGMPKDQLQGILNLAPLTAREALAAGLVDKLIYRDDLWRLVGMDEATTALPKISLREYYRHLQQREKKLKKKAEIVILTMSGRIQTGRRAVSGTRGVLCSEWISDQMRAMVTNEDIKAVILRVNSPGGSVVAADTIRQQITRLKEAGKLVIVSMGDVAASGGYYFSLGAHAIIADPGSLTGSIGVIAGAPFVREAFGNQGVNIEVIKRGANSDLMSPFTEMTKEQDDLMNRMVDHIYSEFLALLRQRRRLTEHYVQSNSGGKVWTGKEAYDRGLVDRLGGLSEAIETALFETRLTPSAGIVEYSPPSGMAEFFNKLFEQLQPEYTTPLSQFKSSIEMYSSDAEVINRSLS